MLSFFVVIMFLIFSANSCKKVGPREMKSSAYWTSPIMNVAQAKKLSQHQVLIIDMENMVNNRPVLELLKTLNPEIKLIAYSNPIEFFLPVIPNRRIQSKWLSQAMNYPNWFLKTGNGEQAIFWRKMVMMNLSSTCPKYEIEIDGKKVKMNYSEWIAYKTNDEVLSDPIWNGHFMDNSGGNISWVYENKPFQFDINNDGRSNSAIEIDNAWSAGVRKFLKAIRDERGKDFIIIGNKGSVEFMDILDGKFFEDWPNDYLGSKENEGWNQSMENAMKMEALEKKYIFFQMKPPTDFQFTLASSLLLDNVYVVVGQDNDMVSPIFKAKLGKPLGPYGKEGNIYSRNYEHAKIIVRPTTKSAKIEIFNQSLAKK
ncbi:hypothetical protein GW934_02465 [Candidatus Falkowbacteria bacterium]|nr:hypothetical protein [Candidatus Falkowbacteria bacterium]